MRSRKGFTLVEIMIVVAIIALLAAIAIPNLLRARITANQSAAQATLRTWSSAAEAWAGANNGNYPANEGDLTGANPPWLNVAVNGVTMNGYTYAVVTAAGGYTVTATPAAGGGNITYTMTTGGVLTHN